MNGSKNISGLLSKKNFFFTPEKLKETMSRKESKFYVINFLDPPIIFFKRKFKHHMQ